MCWPQTVQTSSWINEKIKEAEINEMETRITIQISWNTVGPVKDKQDWQSLSHIDPKRERERERERRN
jgi:hypothetical protein